MFWTKFPDRLLKRIFWTCSLYHQGKAEKIIFTGARYHVDDDYPKELPFSGWLSNLPKEQREFLPEDY